ncbi:ABC transporter permease [Actinomadura algeriensis]|uniref:Transport permease protein n=1 Tax=Actinomadura algeriensis TaxID=1679523 RepID=A0ABR9K0N1_9ACTN|nr:ABC transporter permease [Actinomadura algeriensis]MBE1536387.1 ABC-2 type transport system permease protein [Actinomadura algeriensis]
MSTAVAARPLADAVTMTRRRVKHMLRYPAMTVQLIGMPVVFLLLFVYVFGGTLGNGLAGGGGRETYLDYVTPGIILMTAVGAATSTAISVAMDTAGGIVARFRTMAISRSSILTGHVIGSMISIAISIVVVTLVALAIGFRPDAGPVEWIAAAGLLTLFVFSLTWLAVALGLVAKNPEGASNAPLLLMLLPFFGSGFVPTDSMPTVLRWFAEYQPFTPAIETLRGLLMGDAIGDSAYQTLAWSAGITLVGFLWSVSLFNRDPNR